MRPLELLAIIAGPSGAVLGIYLKSVFDRRLTKANAEEAESIAELNEAQEEKLGADAAAVIANTAMALVAPLQAQVTNLAERVATLETENALTTRRLAIAVAYIQELIQWIQTHYPDAEIPNTPTELGIH